MDINLIFHRPIHELDLEVDLNVIIVTGGVNKSHVMMESI